MTTERARELLGDDIAYLRDEQVIELIGSTKQMCKSMLQTIITKKEVIDRRKN